MIDIRGRVKDWSQKEVIEQLGTLQTVSLEGIRNVSGWSHSMSDQGLGQIGL